MKKKIRTEMAVNKLFGGNFESMDAVWNYIYRDLVNHEDKWVIAKSNIDVSIFSFTRYGSRGGGLIIHLETYNNQIYSSSYSHILYSPIKIKISSNRLRKLLSRLRRKYVRKAKRELKLKREGEELEGLAQLNEYFQNEEIS